MLPREKLIKFGVSSLTNEELLALLLGTGNRSENVFSLSRKLISTLGMNGLKSANVKLLSSIQGMGIAKSSRVVSAVELGRRLFSYDGREVRSMDDIYRMLFKYVNERVEILIVFYIDGSMRLIREEVVAKGRRNIVNVHVRDIVHGAIETNASFIVIAHNHPSGNLKPSEDDLKFTRKLSMILRELEMELLEHVIFSKEGYVCVMQENFF